MKWKIYAWLIGILFFSLHITDPEISQLSDIEKLRKIISIILILGTFCYAYQKAVLNKKFWNVLFIIAVIDELWAVVELKSKYGFNSEFVLIFIINSALILPSFIAVYRYSFKLNGFWTEKQKSVTETN